MPVYFFSEMVHVIDFLITGYPPATVLLTHPKDVTVEVNEWAQFNCTVHCRYHVSWYIAGHSIAIKTNNSVPGLEIRIPSASMCTSDRKCISLRYMLLVHSMHQCFTVLLTRDSDSIVNADVPMGDVTADQLSSQVSLFGMMHFLVFYTLLKVSQ